jgi:hypothetical protein
VRRALVLMVSGAECGAGGLARRPAWCAVSPLVTRPGEVTQPIMEAVVAVRLSAAAGAATARGPGGT